MLVLDMTSKFCNTMLVWGVILFSVSLSFAIGKDAKEKSLKVIHKEWKEAKILPQNLPSGNGAHEFSEAIIYTAVKVSDTLGFALLARVESKSNPVDFLLLLDSNKRITSLHLPGLKGSKNAPLKSKFWRKQFIGATSQNCIIDDVDAISGATISSDAIKAGAYTLLRLISRHQ